MAEKKNNVIPGIVKSTGLSHDFFNVFFGYYTESRRIYSLHKDKVVERKELMKLIWQLKELRLVTYTEWLTELINIDEEAAQNHLHKNEEMIKKIDRSITLIQRMIDQEYEELAFTRYFKFIVQIFNENINSIIDPQRDPLSDKKYPEKELSANSAMFF